MKAKHNSLPIRSLTKRELVWRISEDTGIIQVRVSEAVQHIFDHITATLASGGKVELRNFGVFEVIITKARTGRNLHNPKLAVQIPARAKVKFKAGKEMRIAVANLMPKT